jgi:20S proteasome subunit beta 2
VLGGVDVTGPHIYTVYPHGSTDKLPYATMGSGSLAAMAIFEKNYKDDMTVRRLLRILHQRDHILRCALASQEKEAVDLVDQAIQSGIFNDLGSGSNVDICVLSRKKEQKGADSKESKKDGASSLRQHVSWLNVACVLGCRRRVGAC